LTDEKIPTTSDEFQEGDNLYPSLHISCSEILYYGIRMDGLSQRLEFTHNRANGKYFAKKT